MKKQRIFISVFFLLVFVVLVPIVYTFAYLPRDTSKQQEGIYTIGILTAREERLVKAEGMREGLKQYGFVDENIHIITKNAYGEVEQLDDLAQELVEAGVDVIITTGSFETHAAKRATRHQEIPVVFIGVGCTVEVGLVHGYISTECNITGVDSHYVQLSGKRLEFLKRFVPSTERVLVLYNPQTTPFGPSSVFLYEAAEKLHIELDIVAVTKQEEVLQALNEKSDNVDGVMLMCSLLFESMAESIVEMTLEKKLPVIGVTDRQVEQNMLAFYGSTSYNEGIQAARIVANILKGQDPKIIPIEAPEKLELHVNMDIAHKLGIDIDVAKMPFVDRFVYGKER